MPPYIGFGNDTLRKQPRVNKGDVITCPHCKGTHPLEPDDNGGTLLMFYRCGTDSFLGAVDGRLTVGVKADVSGEI